MYDFMFWLLVVLALAYLVVQIESWAKGIQHSMFNQLVALVLFFNLTKLIGLTLPLMTLAMLVFTAMTVIMFMVENFWPWAIKDKPWTWRQNVLLVSSLVTIGRLFWLHYQMQIAL
jgi:hypothetical protein